MRFERSRSGLVQPGPSTHDCSIDTLTAVSRWCAPAQMSLPLMVFCGTIDIVGLSLVHRL